jgi:elongation factor 1-gamma
LNPQGTCPALKTSEGVLTQSSAISRFLVDSKLKGTGFQAAQVDQIIDFVVSELSGAAATLTSDAFHGTKSNKADLKTGGAQLDKITAYLNSLLVENTFLLGHQMTFADIFVATRLAILFEKLWEPEYFDNLKPVKRWFKTIAAQPNVKKVLGDIKLKEKKSKVVESNFNLEEWKRVYMNSTFEEASAYFWKNLDPRANSVWIAEYKYSVDFKGDPLYKTANLLSGQSQRAQPFAKFTFGILTIVGDEDDNGERHITCCWVYENTKFPEEIKTDSIDYDMFEWKRADWKKDKELIEQYLKCESIGGKKVLESKVFR